MFYLCRNVMYVDHISPRFPKYLGDNIRNQDFAEVSFVLKLAEDCDFAKGRKQKQNKTTRRERKGGKGKEGTLRTSLVRRSYVEPIFAGRSRRLHSHFDVKTLPDRLSYGRGLPNRRIQRKVSGGSFRTTRRRGRVPSTKVDRGI